MAGRKGRRPEVVRLSPRRRLIELGKDLFILLLTVSSVYLLTRTPLFQQAQPAANRPTSISGQSSGESEDLLTPLALAVRNERGLYGVAYDATTMSRAFEQVSPYLGKALTSASGVEETTAEIWSQLRRQPGIYCSFAGKLPLSVLSASLGGSETRLSGTAESLLLVWDGESTALAWREGKNYHRASTTVAYTGGLNELLERFNPNGAAFAETLSARDEVYATLDADVLLTMTSIQPKTYTVTTPDFVNDGSALSQLLTALGFQSGTNSAYQSMGELSINENGDRLRVSSQGVVTFHAGGDTRYSVSSRTETPTAAEAVQAVYPVLQKALAPWREEGAAVLSGVESTPEGWQISFRLLLGGVPAQVGEEGWVAQFTTTGKELSGFTLCVRSYTAGDGFGTVPPARLAAAALTALPASSGKLRLSYPDGTTGNLNAGWSTEP